MIKVLLFLAVTGLYATDCSADTLQGNDWNMHEYKRVPAHSTGSIDKIGAGCDWEVVRPEVKKTDPSLQVAEQTESHEWTKSENHLTK